MVEPVNAVIMVSGFTNAHASVPAIGQNAAADLFTWPILPASMETIFAALALACGYQIVQIYGRFRYRD
jgi:hypothetical protein